MKFTASAIAAFLKGSVEGNPQEEVSDISKIEEGKPGTLSFLANPKYEKYIYETKSSIVIVNKDFKAEKKITATLVRVDDAYSSFASLLEMYEQAKPKKTGIHELAFISESATVGANVYIGPFVYVGDHCVIGDHVRLFPQVHVGDRTKIGDNSMLKAGVIISHEVVIGKNCNINEGTVIGSDGFGFAPKSDKNYKKIPQVGNVIIEDDVEIGANCTIDRATFGSTIIRKGVKLDNLIHVAHNVEIGENCVMAAQTGIAGSTKIGKECMFGGQVGIVGHITLGDRVKIAAQSGVPHDTPDDTTLMGSPAFEIAQYRKSLVIYKNLPGMREQLIQLEREIKELKKKIEDK